MKGGLPFIAVSGNIAAGKSTLVAGLASELSLPAFQEMPDQNPWFERAAGEPAIWSFHAELHFLLEAVHGHRTLVAQQQGGVLERPPAEHVEVFGRARCDRKWLDAGEFRLLTAIWHELSAGLVGAPDILLVLHAPPRQLLARVRERHWQSERGVDQATLENLDGLYAAFVRGWKASPVVRIDTATYDMRSAAGLAHVVRAIEEVLGQ
jgi:deoxyadenosine/deoxycytidine kinase